MVISDFVNTLGHGLKEFCHKALLNIKSSINLWTPQREHDPAFDGAPPAAGLGNENENHTTTLSAENTPQTNAEGAEKPMYASDILQKYVKFTQESFSTHAANDSFFHEDSQPMVVLDDLSEPSVYSGDPEDVLNDTETGADLLFSNALHFFSRGEFSTRQVPETDLPLIDEAMIDFKNLARIEKIDMNLEQFTKISINPQDVLDIAPDNNILIIEGNAENSIDLLGEGWQKVADTKDLPTGLSESPATTTYVHLNGSILQVEGEMNVNTIIEG